MLGPRQSEDRELTTTTTPKMLMSSFYQHFRQQPPSLKKKISWQARRPLFRRSTSSSSSSSSGDDHEATSPPLPTASLSLSRSVSHPAPHIEKAAPSSSTTPPTVAASSASCPISDTLKISQLEARLALAERSLQYVSQENERLHEELWEARERSKMLEYELEERQTLMNQLQRLVGEEEEEEEERRHASVIRDLRLLLGVEWLS